MAFDRVNHWTLFKKLIDRSMPDVFVRLFGLLVRTQNALSVEYCHPYFLTCVMDGLSYILCRTECGCTMGGRMINHLM